MTHFNAVLLSMTAEGQTVTQHESQLKQQITVCIKICLVTFR